MNNKFLFYDIEVYPNIFTIAWWTPLDDANGSIKEVCEISPRKNDIKYIYDTIRYYAGEGYKMVGFNNYGYDYPVLHELLQFYENNKKKDWQRYCEVAKKKSNQIIDCDWDKRFNHMVWDNDQFIPQMDLMKVMHYDNKARATSLKALEFAMRAENIGDLPADPNKPMSESMMTDLVNYNMHDVEQTFNFYKHVEGKIELRKNMSKKYGLDMTNFNDGKIGMAIIQDRLETELGDDICYSKDERGRKVTNKTKRSHIHLEDTLFDLYDFKTLQFQAIYEWFRNQTIKETKGVFSEVPFEDCEEFLLYADKRPKKGKLEKVNVIVGGKYRDVTKLPGRKYQSSIIGGIKYVFGTGGLHASLRGIFKATKKRVIIDKDVTSYYPSIAEVNKLFPAHLHPYLAQIITDLKMERKQFAKKTDENLTFKFALNVPYGNSNSEFSFLFDPQYTMTITINGQLMLCQLAEWCCEIPTLEVIQVNTDGITISVDEEYEQQFEDVCSKWEKTTRLELERADYSRMFIRDCNNYLAEYTDGNVKRKGEFEYDVDWHQNHSMKVVAKAAEAHLIHGTDMEEFIRNHDDVYDFYILSKCPRNSRPVLMDGADGDRAVVVKEVQKVNRYYASTEGDYLYHIAPPLKKKLTKVLIGDFKKLKVEFDQDTLDEIERRLEAKEYWDMDELAEQGWGENELKAFQLCQPKERRLCQLKDSPITIHNKLKPNLTNLNYQYYVDKTLKLINSLHEEEE